MNTRQPIGVRHSVLGVTEPTQTSETAEAATPEMPTRPATHKLQASIGRPGSGPSRNAATRIVTGSAPAVFQSRNKIGAASVLCMTGVHDTHGGWLGSDPIRQDAIAGSHARPSAQAKT